jgi:hypothetical protein
MKMKKMFVIFFLFMPMVVSAGYQSGKISQLNARSDGLEPEKGDGLTFWPVLFSLH